MRRIQTEVLVVGGGATGTGVLRDLAMRGFRCLLVERRDLASGTTGRYHGLLHSGARYVVNDPPAALECIEENRILRRIMPHCLEDTGGLFVSTPADDLSYIPRFLAGCQAAGIPVEEVPVAEMLRQEPRLNPAINRCFRVPDASADSFLAADLNARSAREHGAEVLPYHDVKRLVRHQNGSSRIVGAVCLDLASGEEVHIQSDFVVNASGAWAGRIAASGGIQIPMRPGKGTMVAVNHRVVHSVVNRCKPPSDGDILVPAHTVSIIGTTDEPVADPDSLDIESWEIALMLQEGEQMIPGFRDLRILRAWTGVRPLYQPTESAHSRRITRAHVLIDHEPRDGVGGLITITGGKWTTYRLMAQATVDKLCAKLEVSRPCRTHLEPLASEPFHALGARLRRVEAAELQDSLICECELADQEDIEKAIRFGRARTIDDVRRDTRLGMGPCQGSFCTYRIAGMLEREEGSRIPDINASIRDFLQARWRGLRPVLSGTQLKQERLAEMIYANVMAIDSLPGPQSTVFANPTDVPDPAKGANSRDSAPGSVSRSITPADSHTLVPPRKGKPTFSSYSDILVIGGGLAGLMTAWFAVQRGRTVRVITYGQGALLFASGTVDILGHDPQNRAIVRDLGSALQRLVERDARHPYALAGLGNIEAGVAELVRLCEDAGHPWVGSLRTNSLLPTACGGIRAASFVPESMSSGLLDDSGKRGASFVIVGLTGFLDFFPALLARNLQEAGHPADWVTIEMRLPSRRRFLNGKILAQFFDDPSFCDEFCDLLVSRLPRQSSALPRRLGFPAVLGLAETRRIREQIEHKTGCPAFEIPGLPPSVPGLRLQTCLVRALHNAGVEVLDGMQAISFERAGDKISKVWTEAASRSKPHTAKQFVLATGGILSGGLDARPDGEVVEPVFGIPVARPGEATHAQFLDPAGHPVFRTGVRVNGRFQPIDANERVCYENLFAVGSVLDGSDVVRDASVEGVALATARAVGDLL